MTHDQKIAAIEATADAVGGTVRKSYSGRCMFGRTCYGIVCDFAETCIEEAASRGLRGAKKDSMGLQAIVYWPSVEGEQKNDD